MNESERMSNERRQTLVNKNEPLKEDIKNVRYTVRMGDAEDKRISKYCERTGKTKSDVIREALMRLLENK